MFHLTKRVNIKDLLKGVLKLLSDNAHSKTPYDNYWTIICSHDPTLFPYFRWKLFD